MRNLLTRAGQSARERARGLFLLALLPASLPITACTDAASAGRGGPVTLTVAAASDLAPAMDEIVARFERETGVRVLVTLGASGQLAEQIRQGAPVDLFAAADRGFVEALAGEDLIVRGTAAVYGRGRLVLWTRADRAVPVERVEELAGPDIGRIAIANPAHAPYGRAARQALIAAGVWEAVQPKLVLGESVRQTFHYVETGNVDVALVARSLAGRGDGRWTPVPEALHAPLDQTLAVVRGTAHMAEARRLAAFLLGPEGQTILHDYGFAAPGGAARRVGGDPTRGDAAPPAADPERLP